MASNPNSPPSDVPGVPDVVARVHTYHQRTKHLPGQFAPGPGYLDWANQAMSDGNYVMLKNDLSLATIDRNGGW